ncbi:MAG: hypothetical protein ABH954_01605 [Candidatus Omnitrophota bacterium]
MLKLLRNRKAQNTAEYAILIGLVVGAVIAMQTYIKRNLQASIKHVVDKAKSADSQDIFGTSRARSEQYEPYYLESAFQTSTTGHSDVVEYLGDGAVSHQLPTDKTVTRTGYQKQKAAVEPAPAP